MDFAGSSHGGEDIEIPLVTSAVIGPDFDDWIHYLNRHPTIADSHGKWNDASSHDDIAGTVQCWLYFGLLAVLSGKTIDARYFSATTTGRDVGGPVVNSSLVRSNIIDLLLSVLRLPESECTQVIRRHNGILRAAGYFTQWLESHLTQRSSDLIDVILLSVKILIGTISTAYRNGKHGGYGVHARPLLHDAAQGKDLGYQCADRALERKMKENGWCAHQINKVLSSFSYQTAYYFAKLPRPRSADLGHEDCTKVSCIAWNSVLGHTGARHATDGCSCPFISVSSVGVARIIQSGNIPLVSLEEDVDGNLALRLHTKKWNSRYIAISHVWADGLGNSFENDLPACQLRMLRNYFTDIQKSKLGWLSPSALAGPTTLFWMDTLCIPIQRMLPESSFPSDVYEDIKAKAIDGMNTVYASSTDTLVLDAEMRRLPLSTDAAAKLAYSQCCGWTTRSWALLEEHLSPSVVFALADGIYSRDVNPIRRYEYSTTVKINLAFLGRKFNNLALPLRKIRAEIVARHLDFLVHCELWASLRLRSLNIRSMYVSEYSSHTSFLARSKYAEAWNELLDRASSQPDDSTAIFANLLGVSAYEVLKRKTEQERIALIIRQQKILPLEILFNTGPRLQARLHNSGDDSLEDLWVPEEMPEESIGLLDRSIPQTQAFKNGWVPATIAGDKYSHPSGELFYLQVLEQSLQIHVNGEERQPYMYTIAGSHIPASTFVLDSKCLSTNRKVIESTEHIFIAVNRAGSSSDHGFQEEATETILGHCFLYDAGLLRAMCQSHIHDGSGGHVDDGSNDHVHHTPSCHLVILSRSDGRITTRYNGAVRLSRVTEKEQKAKLLPVLECECNCCNHLGDNVFVDILHDADDLGPLLKPPSKTTPERLLHEHRMNPTYTFFIHSIISSTTTLYIGPIRPGIDTAAWFLVPLAVYLYQRIIVKAALQRLLLDNHRSHIHRPSARTSRVQTLRRRIDAVVTAHWTIVFFGLILDILFWLIFSSHLQFSLYATYNLLFRLSALVYFYLKLGSKRRYARVERFAKWLFIFMVMLVVGPALFIFTSRGFDTLALLGFVSPLGMLGSLWLGGVGTHRLL